MPLLPGMTVAQQLNADLRLEAALAPGHRLGKQAEDLPHYRDAYERGVAAHVERRRDLDDIAADQIEPAQAADHALRLMRCVTADFGRAGTGGVGRIEPVDVEA